MVIFTQTGCRENTLIRSKVLPANDTVGVKSYTLNCITHTYYDDTAITSTDIGGIPCYQAVGTYYDQFFGTMVGSTFFQVSFGSVPNNVFAGYTIDSAILVLPYSGFTYGDTSSAFSSLTQTYQVFYMLDSLSNPAITNYFSYSSKPVDISNPLSDPTTVNIYHIRDSVGTYTQDYNYPALRIKLRIPALMQHLNPALNLLSTSTNLPQDWFNAFNGICVMPANTNPLMIPHGPSAMPYFQLDGSTEYSEAGILVYSHLAGTSAPVIDTAPIVFPFDPTICSHFNNITRSYSRYPVNNLLRSSQVNDSIIVLQNQPGASLDILIPGMKSIPKGVVISNAQLQLNLLTIPLYASDTNSAQLPERLYPVGIGNATYPTGVGNGVAYNLADRYPTTSLTPLAYMDGYWHLLTVGSNVLETYTINIPREVMASIAANNDTLHLHITGTQDFYGAFKMVAGGGTYSNPLYQPKFVITYSKLNN